MLTQYQLKNKLKILLVESHKAPVVAVQMWVKTGSADEKKGEEGISHFIEHLVFKGTKKFGVGEVAKTIEGSGGELNAYTTFDHTVFHVTMSRDDLEVGLDCISEMMGFPKFDPVEIDKEREVVIEEIKRSFDNPYNVAVQRLFSTTFKKHPYGTPVIGFEKNIKTVKPKTLVNYYHRRYVPSNMTLVVAGDFDRKKLKSLISKYYSPFAPHALKKVKRNKEAKQSKATIDYLPAEFKEAALNVSFRVPHAKHPDVPALDVLGYIMGQGDSSRLVKKMRLERPLVLSVSAGSFNPLDAGLFAISCNFKADKLDDIMSVLGEQLAELLSVTPSMEELDRARTNLEAEEVFSLETVDGLARKVGMFQTLLDDPTYVAWYLKQVQKLTPYDIAAVARKYFRADNLVATLMVNKDESATISRARFQKQVSVLTAVLKEALKIKPSRVSVKMSRPAPLKIPLKMPASEDKIVKHRLSNGALIILKRNPEVPVVHAKVGFLGGMRIEPLSVAGATTLLSNVWTSGSKLFTENEIAARIESAAGALAAFGGRNSIGMTAESVTVHEEKAFGVFKDVLLNPTFPQEAISREAMMQVEHIRSREDHPANVAAQLFMEKLFVGHPYSRDVLGTEETLKKLTTDNIRQHWKNMVTSENAVFVVVGDFKPDQQIRFFENISRNLEKGSRHGERFQLAPLSSESKHFTKSKKEQSHIIVGYRGLSFTDPDRYALQLLQSVLAGQGGRLFLELRDKASLAYTVAPLHMDGIDTGYFGVYIGCSPEKGQTAIRMIHQELDKVVQDQISDADLDRAKRYLIGRNHIDLQRNGAQASSILFDELYGIDCQETFRFAEHLKDITAENVRAVAQRIMKAPSVTVAVGPVEPW
jgi:zinc protease